MNKTKVKTFVISFVVLTIVLLAARPVNATIIWGVTGSMNMNHPGARSEVFKVDTTTWTAEKLYTTTLDYAGRGRNFSDIAVTPSGRVYSIGSDYKGGGSYFKDFFRLDPTTGQVINSWLNINHDRGKPLNALTAVSDATLLAVEGGWSSQKRPHLVEITLDPITGEFLAAASIGQIDRKTGYSGGDIVGEPDSSYFLAALGGGDDFYRVDPTDPVSASKDFSSALANIAGLAYDFDAMDGPSLLGGIFTDTVKRLYSISPADGAMVSVFRLNDNINEPLTWNTFGLDSVPEPATIMLLGLGSLVLLRRKRSA